MKNTIQHIIQVIFSGFHNRSRRSKTGTVPQIERLPLKAFLWMSTEEKVLLLFSAFPGEVPAFLDSALRSAHLFMQHPEQFRKLGLASIGEFGWQNLAQDMEVAIKESRDQMEKDHRFMVHRLFTKWDSIFAIYCLFAYRKTCENKTFARAVNRVFLLG